MCSCGSWQQCLVCHVDRRGETWATWTWRITRRPTVVWGRKTHSQSAAVSTNSHHLSAQSSTCYCHCMTWVMCSRVLLSLMLSQQICIVLIVEWIVALCTNSVSGWIVLCCYSCVLHVNNIKFIVHIAVGLWLSIAMYSDTSVELILGHMFLCMWYIKHSS